MKMIPVGDYVALVDDEDYDQLCQYSWSPAKRGEIVYAVTYNKTAFETLDGVFMHTLVTGFKQTDHINQNGLDNQRENLRSTTNSLNQGNVGKRNQATTSRFKGVCWDNTRRCWRAYIGLNKKHYGLGYFKDEQEAARAYDARAREFFGEHARLNFPEPGENGIVAA